MPPSPVVIVLVRWKLNTDPIPNLPDLIPLYEEPKDSAASSIKKISLELQKSTEALNEDVKAMSAQMNKWGGLGAGLMLLGAVVGWFGTIYFTTK